MNFHHDIADALMPNASNSVAVCATEERPLAHSCELSIGGTRSHRFPHVSNSIAQSFQPGLPLILLPGSAVHVDIRIRILVCHAGSVEPRAKGGVTRRDKER
jgi:hypothetical protein